MHCLERCLCWHVFHVLFLSKLGQSQDHSTVIGLLHVDVFCHDWIEQRIVEVALLDELLIKDLTQHLSDLHQLLAVKFRRSMDEGGVSRFHIIGRPEFFDVG